MNVKILVLLTALMLILAACAGTPAATTEPGVGVTGPTDAAGGAASPTTDAGAASPTTAAGGGAGVADTCLSVPDPQAFVMAGQGVYETNCAGCHGAQGEGTGDFPPLANSANVVMEDPIGLVVRYFEVEAHPKTLTADDVASVLSYARASFGNSATVVCPDQVLENMPAQ